MRVRKSKTVMPRRGFLVEGASKFFLGLSGLSMSMSFLQPATCFSKKFLRTYWREQKGHENDSGSSVGLVILVSSEWSLKVTFFTFFIVRLVFMFLWKLRNAQIILHILTSTLCVCFYEGNISAQVIQDLSNFCKVAGTKISVVRIIQDICAPI